MVILIGQALKFLGILRPLNRVVYEHGHFRHVGLRTCSTGREYKPLPGAELSTVPTYLKKDGYKLVIVGGGCGGMAVAHTFNRKLGAGNVVIIEPRSVSLRTF